MLTIKIIAFWYWYNFIDFIDDVIFQLNYNGAIYDLKTGKDTFVSRVKNLLKI